MPPEAALPEFAPAKRMELLPPYLFVELDRLKRAAIARGNDVINLGIGDPDLPTPQLIIDAMKEAVLDMIADFVDTQNHAHLNPELEPEERDVSTLRTAIIEAIPQLEEFDFEELRVMSPDEATDALVPVIEAKYEEREQELGADMLRQLERFIVLQVVDQHWKEQLHNMDVLRQGIGLRGYGQRNPLQEYGFEAFNLFEEMNAQIKLDVARLLFRVQVQVNQPLERAPQPRQAALTYDGGEDSTTATPMPVFGGAPTAGVGARAARPPQQQGMNRAQRRRQERLARKSGKAD